MSYDIEYYKKIFRNKFDYDFCQPIKPKFRYWFESIGIQSVVINIFWTQFIPM